MTPGEHATHTVVKFPALNSGQHESKQESKPDAVAPWDTPLGANNLLRKIVLRPAEWEGVRVPPRRWFAQNRIPMREVTGLGGDGGENKEAAPKGTRRGLHCLPQETPISADGDTR